MDDSCYNYNSCIVNNLFIYPGSNNDNEITALFHNRQTFL